MDARDYEKFIQATPDGYTLKPDTPPVFREKIDEIFDYFSVPFDGDGSKWIWEQIIHTLEVPLIDHEVPYSKEREELKEYIYCHEWNDVDEEVLLEFLRQPFAEEICESFEVVNCCFKTVRYTHEPKIFEWIRQACRVAHFEIADWLAAAICPDDEEEDEPSVEE